LETDDEEEWLMKRMLLAIALLAFSLPALAQKPTVSMLDLGGTGDAGDADVIAVTDSLAAALDKAGAFDVIAPMHRDQLLLRSGFWIEGFRNLPERLIVAGRCLTADRMIGGQLDHGSAGFGLSLQLVDVASGAVSAQFKQERLADRGAVFDALTDAVRQFLGATQLGDTLKNSAPRGSYKIDSRPAGAKLYVEGLVKGVTPLRVDSLLTGPHQVFLDFDKYRRTYYVIRVRKGGLDSATVRLEPKKAGEPDRPAPGNPQANQSDTQSSRTIRMNSLPSYSDEITGEIPGKNAYVAVDKNPEPIKTPQPEYQGRLHGKVYIQMLVGTEGQVMRADVAKSSGVATLDNAAVDAAKQWLFTPAIAPGGKPVRVWVMQAFTFKKN
jgi:TonB family protein